MNMIFDLYKLWLRSAEFDLLDIYNMQYRNLQKECKKFNDSQPEANQIFLKQNTRSC
jgi:hypothetical protein